MTRKPVMIRAIFWYESPEQYDRYLSLCIDAHMLPASYESWLRQATQRVEELTRSGDVVIKVNEDPDVFAAWAKGRGLDIDARARNAFATLKAAEHGRQIGGDA